MFRAMDGGNCWIQEKAAASLNPSQVETTLVQLSEQWPEKAPPLVRVIEQFPLGETALLHLLAVSSICATRLTRNPQTLLWLCKPEVCLASRGHAQMFHELHAMADGSIAKQDFATLRLWKGAEMTRVALRELANVAPLEETTGELSLIAEICIRGVLEHWNAEFRKRYGSPNAEFAILALGKLGGGELNHSSDVDLLFLYSDEGQLASHLSYHEFFNWLGKKILETFSTPHPQGSLFRVDLRLRPEGSAGPLARSLESMENYYAGFGETWERLALIKARGIAGSRELAYECLRQHQPFIYPKSATADFLDEIANIKRPIERDVVGPDKLKRDVKLRRGGIREIEFIVAALHERMGSVRPIFQRIISETPADLAKIHLEIFNDPKRAAKALGDLERGPGSFHVAPRTRQISRKLQPILMDWLGKAADPDATLNQFVRFVEAYGLRSLLFELLVANPKLLELVVKAFDASRFAGDLLTRRPQLLEEITRDPTFSGARPMAEHLRRLDSLGVSAFHLDPVRAYRQRQILRTMLRDVLHSGRSATSKNFGLELSDLAEACLLFTIRLLAGKQLTVIALGKFGGHELSYGADLDVLFVGGAHSSEMKASEEVRAAQNLVVNMAQPTSEGNIWVLDARLRPEGEKGPLVCPLETYQTYYESRAQLWEIHALTRAL